jgi:hypothetical protein
MELFNKKHASCEAGFDQPLIAYLNAKKEGRFTPPYIPEWDVGPLYQLCQKALMWHAASFENEAKELVSFILKHERFPTLWCPEKLYDEQDLSLLFAAIKEISLDEFSSERQGAYFLKNQYFDAAFTAQGFHSSLGAIYSKGFEIRAFGPQPLPLKDPGQFGVFGEAIDYWICSASQPEVWLKMQPLLQDRECKLDLHFVGVTPEEPLAFCFYVKTPFCSINGQEFKPKILTRFSGEGQRVDFQKITMESSQVHKIQIIPLAGFGGFWNCDFIVAFEIHPLQNSLQFSIINH